MSLLAASHLLLATDDVSRMTRFFAEAFAHAPRFANDLFAEFVLPSRFRIAFFQPVGAAGLTFRSRAERDAHALGLTVADVDTTHARLTGMRERYPLTLSGPPRDHPWGERSFLLTDPDGNRWEITQSPSADGMLRDRQQ